ncbi:MAG: binding-protein-dependent transport system inner rane component [Herbinix sp.]|nr:binding-protein-dependent transport system inner rane component [Herbinix sp.]
MEKSNRIQAKNIRLIRLKTKYVSTQFLGSISWRLIRTIILLGLGFIILYPIIVKVIASFMTVDDLIDPSVKYFPRHPILDNIKHVYYKLNYPKSLLNSVAFSGAIAISQVVVSTFAGYGFARFKFFGKNLIFGLLMLTLLMPPQATLVPLFLTFKYFSIGPIHINLLNTIWPFIILSLTGLNLKGGLYVFMMRQYYRGLPKELEEAAFIDGAGAFKTFFYIVLPNGIPLMVTIFLFAFTWQWSEAIYTPLLLPNIQVLTRLMLNVISPNRDIDPAYLSVIKNTAGLFTIFPIIIVYLTLQRYFIKGIERSGIVG